MMSFPAFLRLFAEAVGEKWQAIDLYISCVENNMFYSLVALVCKILFLPL